MSDLEKYGVPDLAAHIQGVNAAHAAEFGHLQAPGAITPWLLLALEDLLKHSFAPGTRLHTIETGCGASTVRFSQLAHHHTVFCSDDRGTPASLVDGVKSMASFKAGATEFVLGPVWENLWSYVPLAPYDVALIGGTRSHPGPEIEYAAISRWLKKGSILILRDIHIPTVQALFRTLCEEECLMLSRIDNAAAIFWVAATPLPSDEPPPWWTQRYNIQNFPAFDAFAYAVGHTVPFKFVYDGWLNKLPSHFKYGAMLSGGRPAFSGTFAFLSFNLDRAQEQALEIELVVECPTARVDRPVNMRPQVNRVDLVKHEITSPEVKRLTFTASLGEATSLDLLLEFGGAPMPSELGWPDASIREQLMAMRLHSIAVRPIRDAGISVPVNAHSISRTDGTVVSFDVAGTQLRFLVNDAHDSIQAHHSVGQLYEIDELALLAQHVSTGTRVLDVGANIGNHTVWFAKIAGATRVVPIEPQPRMMKLLELNCALNGLSNVDLSKLGCAFGRSNARGTIRISDAFNPAGASIEADPEGEVQIRPGDDVIEGADFDFVKIDVEGAELDVIDGLGGLIARCRPMLFVEVANENIPAFRARLDAISYEVIGEHRRYEVSTNLLARAKPRA